MSQKEAIKNNTRE